MPVIDRTGQRYGRLTVLALCDHRKFRRSVWRCACDCGNSTEVEGSKLADGTTSSCGCLKIDDAAVRFTKHGMSTASEYFIWKLIIARCTNPNSKSYRLYGGRGIKISPEWRADFMAFYADMGARPSLEHTVDRINFDGNYCKENCRWADKFEQANNRRNNHFVSVFGERLTIAQAARKYKVRYGTAADRIRRGISPEEALNVSPGGDNV